MVATSTGRSAALTVLRGQLAASADPDPNGGIGLVSVLEQLHADQTKRLPVEVRHRREVVANKLQLVVEAHEAHNAASRFLHAKAAAELRGGTQLWDDVMAELDGSLSEPQRRALEVIKDNFVARKVQNLERSEELLTAVLQEELAKALAMPDHEWRQQTWWEAFREGFTNRESELARQGLPPLTRWQSFLNALGWGFADRRIDAARRERMRAFAPIGPGMETIDAEAIG